MRNAALVLFTRLQKLDPAAAEISEVFSPPRSTKLKRLSVCLCSAPARPCTRADSAPVSALVCWAGGARLAVPDLRCCRRALAWPGKIRLCRRTTPGGIQLTRTHTDTTSQR